MKTKLLSVVAIAAAMASCAGRNGAANQDSTGVEGQQDAVAAVDLTGKWYLENIVVNDSDYVRPSEAVPGVEQYVIFSDSTYVFQTNCNTISGPCSIKGDSIRLEAGLMTEMACDNMATEDILRRVIPNIATIDVQNDSVVRLNGATPAECILLRKAAQN